MTTISAPARMPSSADRMPASKISQQSGASSSPWHGAAAGSLIGDCTMPIGRNRRSFLLPGDDLMFANIEQRRVGQIDEPALVFQQRPSGRSSLGRTSRLDEVLDAVPRDFGDSVVRRYLATSGVNRRID